MNGLKLQSVLVFYGKNNHTPDCFYSLWKNSDHKASSCNHPKESAVSSAACNGWLPLQSRLTKKFF